MKKDPQVFIQGTSVPNFSHIQPFLGSVGCPKVFRQTDTQTYIYSSSTEVENISRRRNIC